MVSIAKGKEHGQHKRIIALSKCVLRREAAKVLKVVSKSACDMCVASVAPANLHPCSSQGRFTAQSPLGYATERV